MNANKMTAIDLAEYLTEYSVIKEGPFSQIIGTKAAAMLRKQHEAIKVLRGTLQDMRDYQMLVGDYRLRAAEVLKETEEFK